nr:hypothetical protein [Comamonas testosteroni]
MSEQRKRTIVRPVRLTPEEDKAISEAARFHGVTVSALFRDAALSITVDPAQAKKEAKQKGAEVVFVNASRVNSAHITGTAQIVNELRRLGGLQKKVHNDTDGIYSKETAGILVGIKDAIAALGSGNFQGFSDAVERLSRGTV